MNILIVDCTEDGDKNFNKKLYRYLNRHSYAYQNIQSDNTPPLNEIENKFTHIIITGVPKYYSLDSIYERAQHIEWLNNTDLPVLGICLGHQVIGYLNGAKIIEKGEGEDGNKQIEILRQDDIFNDLPNPFSAHTLHNASISVPEGFHLLASSENCKNEVMKHESKPIYGLQFHPERSNSTELIIDNFLGI